MSRSRFGFGTGEFMQIQESAAAHTDGAFASVHNPKIKRTSHNWQA
jgi:hypothetical protein